MSGFRFISFYFFCQVKQRDVEVRRTNLNVRFISSYFFCQMKQQDVDGRMQERWAATPVSNNRGFFTAEEAVDLEEAGKLLCPSVVVLFLCSGDSAAPAPEKWTCHLNDFLARELWMEPEYHLKRDGTVLNCECRMPSGFQRAWELIVNGWQ